MDLEIVNVSGLHQHLRIFNSLYISLAEMGEGEDSDGHGIGGSFLKGNAVRLPAPMKFARIDLNSRAGMYSLSGVLLARSSKVFGSDFSDTFTNAFNKPNSKYEWIALNKNGVGYVSERGVGRPVISINCASSSENRADDGRVVSLGDFGAEFRKVSEGEENFTEWVGLLQSVMTSYLMTCYEINGGLDSKYQRISLSLDCLL